MIAFRHIAMRTQDIQQSRRFYEKGLGLTFVGFRPSGAAMDLSDGRVNLTLIPYDGSTRTALQEGTEFIHIGVLVDDLSAVYQRLVDMGAVIERDDVKERRPHQDQTVPVGSFKTLDPDGNVIDISEKPDEWRA